MAYKKQLEEEYRIAAEKIQVKGKKHLGYTLRLSDIKEAPYSYDVMDKRKMAKLAEKDEEEMNRQNKIISECNRLNAIVEENLRKDRLQATEEKNSKKEKYQRVEERTSKKEKEVLNHDEVNDKIKDRLNCFEKDNEEGKSECLAVQVMEQKISQEEEITISETASENIEEQLIKEEQARLEMEEQLRLEKAKKLEEEKKMIEMKELEEIRNLQFQEDARADEPTINVEDEQAIKDLEQKEFEEMKKTEERIKQLELSIASLDDELERFDIERMKNKTKKVMKRMSLVISDTTDDELDDILKQTTVNGFMENEVMWEKYLKK